MKAFSGLSLQGSTTVDSILSSGDSCCYAHAFVESGFIMTVWKVVLHFCKRHALQRLGCKIFSNENMLDVGIGNAFAT